MPLRPPLRRFLTKMTIKKIDGPSWPSVVPEDLKLRMLDVLSYAELGPDHLWDEFAEWLEEQHVQVPAQLRRTHNDSLVALDHAAFAQRPREEEFQMQLTRLMYTSVHASLGKEDVDRLLRSSRSNNGRDGITGALVVTDSRFLQVLEGSRSAVGHCFLRIMQDTRHREIEIVACRDAERRLFLEWTMHGIDAASIKADVLARYAIHGKFDPAQMSQFAIEDLCRTLAGETWRAAA
jgi:hypothetical protein